MKFLVVLSLSFISFSSFAKNNLLISDLSKHNSFAIIFDKSEMDSYRSGSLVDTKNNLTLAVRCYKSAAEETFAVKLTDQKLNSVELDIGEADCVTLLNEVIKDGDVSKSNPLLTAWNSFSGTNTDGIRLSAIQLDDKSLEINSNNHDELENDLREREVIRAQFIAGQRRLFIAPSDAIVIYNTSAFYVKSYDGNLKIRTGAVTIKSCQMKAADTVERFFRHLAGDNCYRF